MQAPSDTVNEWNTLKQWKDITQIAKALKLKRSNTSVIVNTGKGTVDQIAYIVKFYNKRKKAINAVLSETDQN